MKISKEIYNKIMNNVDEPPPEIGVVLGSLNDIITEAFLDKGVKTEKEQNIYLPNTSQIAGILDHWESEGVMFCGIAHTHPKAQKELSNADKAYIYKILTVNADRLEKLYFPIVANGQIIPYKCYLVSKVLRIEKEVLIII